MSLFGQITASSSQFINERGIYLGRRSSKLHVTLYRRSGGRFGGHIPAARSPDRADQTTSAPRAV